VRIDPRRLRAALLSPPLSKSDAHRALVLAHLLGRSLEAPADAPGDVRVIRAGLLALAEGADAEIDCADGGAPLRFLIGQAAITPGARVRFRGSERLGGRPHGALLDSLREALGSSGLRIEVGTPWPITVQAPAQPVAPRFRIAGRDSSQHVSSLLLAAAALVHRSGRPSVVEIEGEVASAGYLALTVDWIARAGFQIDAAPARVAISGFRDRGPLPPIPGDWSSLGYLLLIAWRCGGRVARVDLAAAHPDRAVVAQLASVGLRVVALDGGEARVDGELSGGLSASARECPDLVPTLAALACLLPAPSRFGDVAILRAKESDRLAGIQELAAAAGARTELDGDRLTVFPATAVPHELAVESHGDHRRAMAAATLAVLAGVPLTLDDGGCVDKSFPGFFDQLAAAGVAVA
jgi:3-phosphoshikimate 1-carboxyvinyltransferase